MRLPNLQCRNELHFYSREGRRIHLVTVPSQVRNPTRSCRSTQFCADGIKTGGGGGGGELVRFSDQASYFALLVSVNIIFPKKEQTKKVGLIFRPGVVFCTLRVSIASIIIIFRVSIVSRYNLMQA